MVQVSRTSGEKLSLGSKLVVAGIFTLLGLTFIATTASLYLEFRDASWFTIAAINSHLFIFFPTFGILALCAFFIPAAVFVDFYWKHVTYGRVRFTVGFVVLAVLAIYIAGKIQGGDQPLTWWLTPQTLKADRADPPGCVGTPAQGCRRVAALDALAAIREASQTRMGLSPLVRSCKPDPYIEVPAELLVKRYCFPTKSLMTAPECCRAQATFAAHVKQLYDAERGVHSTTAWVHDVTLPFKVFFLFVLLAIGILLAIWRRRLDVLYWRYSNRIERGVIIGALAMLIWPVSNHAYLQTASLLYGDAYGGFYATISPGISLLFAAWALLLVLFFFRRQDRDLEKAGKMAGGFASAIAVLKYNEIVDFAMRFVGSGSDPFEIGVLAAALFAAFLALLWGSRFDGEPHVAPPPQPGAGPMT